MTWIDAVGRGPLGPVLVGHVLSALGFFGSADPAPATLVLGTAAAALLVAVALTARMLLVRPVGRPGPQPTGGTLRAASARIGMPRHADPDGAGHRRPRAPSVITTVA